MVLAFINDIVSGVSNAIEGSLNSLTDWIKAVLKPSASTGNSTGTPTVDFTQVTQQIKNSQNAITSIISNKITNATQSIENTIKISEAHIINKLSGQINLLKNTIDNQTDRIKDIAAFNTNLVTTAIDSQTNIISGKLLAQTSTIKTALNLVEQNIAKRFDNLTTDIKAISKLEIATEKLIAQEFINTWNNLFSELPSDIAQELYNKFNVDTVEQSQDILDWLLPRFKDRLSEALIDSFKSKEFREAINPPENLFLGLINAIFNGIGATSNVVTDIVHVGGEAGTILNNVLNVIGTDDLFRMIVELIAEPYLRHLYHQSERGARSDLLSIDQLLSLYLRNPHNEPYVKSILQYHGHTDEDIQRLLNLTKTPLSENEIQTLHYRGYFTAEEMINELHRIGIRDELIPPRLELWKLIPPIQDIIRMAVRDVFSPNIVSEFGLDENIPERYLYWAKKTGLPDEWAKHYWSAHWVLPSSNQGFEMFQRRIINEKQLTTLLQALDIVPAWREKLIQLNYRPITRVDVRRMRKMGFLNFEEMVLRYRDIGLSPEDARLLGLWTDAYNGQGEEDGIENTKQLSQSVYIKSYILGRMTREQAIQGLTTLGYSIESAEILLDLEQIQHSLDTVPDKLKDNYRRIENLVSKGFLSGTLAPHEVSNYLGQIGFTEDEIQSELTFLSLEKETALHEIIIDLIKTKFIQYQISVNDARQVLSANGIGDNEASLLISQWNIYRLHRTKLPTKAEIKSWLDSGVIDVGQAQQFLRGLGHPDDIIELYIADWT